MPFNPKGKATIGKLEITNGSSDDSIEHADFSIKFDDQPCQVVQSVLGVDTVDEVERSFFRTAAEDAEQNTRFLGVKRITCNAKWEGKHRIKVRGLRTIRVAAISAVTLVPRGHAKFDMGFKVRIDQPPSGYVDGLAKVIGKAYDVEFEHDAELFDAKPDLDDPRVRDAVRASIKADAPRKPKAAAKKSAKRPVAKKAKQAKAA